MAKTVLVVDDSSTARKFVTFALRAQGLTVLTACDGLEALEKLAQTPVDLVITDLNMPKLDGIGLVQALRADPEYAHIPILVLSSLEDAELVSQSQQLGVQAYLTKPFDAQRLQYEVAKFIS
ncbi:response regulator [Rhodothermus bifroesti]|jgi:two-component system chemotaxis response regulator CheY|uniref:Response regulator n=1 Tax=Rhodothermus marinus TaxID=29549 RepID=A0A7V2B0E4_RHOMR|nr:response regulator [Rhodothermus bifroesti]GBD01306.1 Chemotaxis protein CheY [bacterium HR18]